MDFELGEVVMGIFKIFFLNLNFLSTQKKEEKFDIIHWSSITKKKKFPWKFIIKLDEGNH